MAGISEQLPPLAGVEGEAGMTAPKPRVRGLNARGLGRLADRTPYFAPLGEIPYAADEDKVQCHLCGDWFRLVGASHLRWHGWTLDQYREAFHLLKRTSTASAGVSAKLRRNAIARKQNNELWANPPRTPRLTGRGVPRWRSVAALRPDLAAQLHAARNGDLDPQTLGLGSTRRVWWRCGACGYEWRASIRHRVSTGAGCRRCTSPAWRVPRERSLAVLHPEPALSGREPAATGRSRRAQRDWLRGPANDNARLDTELNLDLLAYDHRPLGVGIWLRVDDELRRSP
jgi:putative zinc ribbon protein/ROS/MUCR transcriptional regulator protein